MFNTCSTHVDTKKGYGEFKNVKLTDEEYAKLNLIHGKTRLEAGIEILGDYMESKGKRYKSHYAVLKKDSWVWTRIDEKNIGDATSDRDKEIKAAAADAIWQIKERGGDAAEISQAIKVLRDKWQVKRGADKSDPVTRGVDLAMNNKREAG